MKKIVIAVSGAILVAVVAFALNPRNQEPTQVLNVNDFRSDPAAFSGTLSVTGIMAAVSKQEPRIFGMMDKTELVCANPNCQKFYLPVRYSGQPPTIGDEIVVTGSYTKVEEGWIFLATKVNILRNHKM